MGRLDRETISQENKKGKTKTNTNEQMTIK